MKNFSHKDILVWLNSLYMRNKTIEYLIEYFKDITLLWTAPAKEIMNMEGLKYEIKNKLISYRNEDYLEKILDKIKKLDVEIITVLDEDYPERLRNIDDSPALIYTKGKFKDEDNLSLAIVGSRKATSYGKWASEKISGELAKIGVTIVSGLARGIDTEAHKGALKEGGRTIAVLGSGINEIYPKNNEKLFYEIENSGAVISEFPIDTKPFSHNFPQRNRIISGLSLGVIIVEAGERSGSLITANFAADQGREVFAVPGNINSIFSRGTNRLIKDGAKIVMDIDDILEEISELKEKVIKVSKKGEIDFSKLEENEAKILKCIVEKPVYCNDIVYITGLDISTVNSVLTALQLKGMIRELGGKIFTLS
jgi:DNA processing protein